MRTRRQFRIAANGGQACYFHAGAYLGKFRRIPFAFTNFIEKVVRKTLEARLGRSMNSVSALRKSDTTVLV